MDPILRVKHLSVRYGANQALTDVTLNVEPGEYLGIIGPNGGGKTTLLKAILGLVPATSGSVSVCGKAAGKAGSLVGYVPQFSAMEKTFPVSVNEVVLTGRLTKKNRFSTGMMLPTGKPPRQPFVKSESLPLQAAKFMPSPAANSRKC